jgi:YHS domain-containing protein
MPDRTMSRCKGKFSCEKGGKPRSPGRKKLNCKKIYLFQKIKKMNQIVIALAVGGILIAGCTENNKPKSAQEPVVEAPSKTMVSSTKSPAEITDPVCGMIKDSTWTDYTVYNNDTVWFCASSEKEAFVANPKKYMK